MNEQDSRRDQELEPVQDNPPAEIDENDPRTIKGSRRQSSRSILWTACALYLLYLSYSLIKGLTNGEVEGSSRTISLVGAIFFILAAGFMLFSVIRTALRSFKDSVQNMVEADVAEERAEAQRRELEAANADEPDPADEEAE